MSSTNGTADPPEPATPEPARTVANFLLTLAAQKGYAPASLAAFASDLAQFAAYLAGRRVGRSDPTGLRYFKRYYGRTPHQTAS